MSGKENSNDGIHLYGSDGTHSTSMPSLPRPRWRAQAGVRCFLIRADLIWNEDLIRRKNHAEGCVDETAGSETGIVLSGTNGRYSRSLSGIGSFEARINNLRAIPGL